MRTKADRVLSYTFGAYFVGMGVLSAVNAEWLGVVSCGMLAIIFGIVNYHTK
ncbi:hypothetical protein [Bacillus velezensis]|uniref:hypothetical protein n=1 Tax=Bacillus velezensis TaxID=492670 RepID=UPI003EB8BDF1